MVLDRLRRALAPTGDLAVEYRCPSCDRSFAYSAAVSDPSCPYCDADELAKPE